MRELKIGMRLASLRQPFKQALHTAAQLGAQGVEIDVRNHFNLRDYSHTAIRQVRKILDDLNLRVCAVTFQTRRGYDVQEELEARVAATKRAMKLAYELGAPLVINQVGRVPADSDSEAWQLMCQALADLGHHGQHVGALLAADTGTESGEDLARLLAALPAGSLAINFNPGNLIVNGFSPRDTIQAVGDHILHVHANDAVRDLARGRGLEVPLGRGSADFPELIGALEEHQYNGYLTVERQQSEYPVQELGAAVSYLQHLARS